MSLPLFELSPERIAQIFSKYASFAFAFTSSPIRMPGVRPKSLRFDFNPDGSMVTTCVVDAASREDAQAFMEKLQEESPEAFAEQWDLIGNLVAAAREDRSHDALRKALRAYMSELSEEYWCAGWLHDVEVLLWQDVTGEITFLTSEQSEKLRTLSTLCGGWHTYDEFVPLDEWERRFAQRTTRPPA